MIEKLDLFHLGFTNEPWGTLCYNHIDKTIQIIVHGERNEKQNQKIEQEIEAMLSHETIHAVLHSVINKSASRYYDKLGEYMGHTPYSFPQSLR